MPSSPRKQVLNAVAVAARVADSVERGPIWESQKEALPTFAEYEESAGDREIPVVILEPR